MRLVLLVLPLLACGRAERDTSDSSSADTCDATWFFDDDGDGHGDPDQALRGCTAPAGYVAEGDDCDDADPAVSPEAAEDCAELDRNCDGDATAGAADAADWFRDADGDLAGDPLLSIAACTEPAGYVATGDDCDDDDATASPTASERCNGTDDDCDGTIDEGDAIGGDAYFRDADGDGHGDPDDTVVGCAAPAGYVADDNDCDDTAPDVAPGASELCNGRDDDCDGNIDEDAVDRSTWYADHDGDGYGDPSSPRIDCDAPADHVDNALDCDDDDATVSPASPERCGGGDENCDGTVDEPSAEDANAWFYDADADGHGDASLGVTACDAPAGYVAAADDCDDADAAVNPDASEVCGGGDENCDTQVDESGAVGEQTWYSDLDLDGYGDDTSARLACTAAATEVATPGDCDDALATVSPGEVEDCATADDDDCDGSTTNGCGLRGTYTESGADLVVQGATESYLGRDGLLIADLDGDGVGTLIAATAYGAGGTHIGTVLLFDGAATGTLAYSDAELIYTGTEPTDALSSPVLADDQDGDGVRDLFAVRFGSGYFDCAGGVVLLPGGASGSVALPCGADGVYGDAGRGEQLYGLTAATDFDGDGVDDIVGWASRSGWNLFITYGPITSWSHVVSADVEVTAAAGAVPSAMATGDFDGDGHNELLYAEADRVWRCESPRSGSGAAAAGCFVAVSEGTASDIDLGDTLATLGDTDGDGADDGLVVGAPSWSSSTATSAEGEVLRFTGSLVGLDVADADAVWEGTAAGEALGRRALFTAGDADQDGEADVGFTDSELGTFMDYGGAGHSGAYTDADVAFTGTTADLFGYTAAAGDLNGDGVIDLATAAIWDDTTGTDVGAIYVLMTP